MGFEKTVKVSLTREENSEPTLLVRDRSNPPRARRCLVRSQFLQKKPIGHHPEVHHWSLRRAAQPFAIELACCAELIEARASHKKDEPAAPAQIPAAPKLLLPLSMPARSLRHDKTLPQCTHLQRTSRVIRPECSFPSKPQPIVYCVSLLAVW
jgi:hypothetical protein